MGWRFRVGRSVELIGWRVASTPGAGFRGWRGRGGVRNVERDSGKPLASGLIEHFAWRPLSGREDQRAWCEMREKANWWVRGARWQ